MAGSNGFQGWVIGSRIPLEPGAPVMLQSDDVPEPVRTYYVGQQEDLCLVVRLPLTEGVSWRIPRGSQITGKFLASGTVYGFHAEVMGKHFDAPLRLLFITFPKAVETVDIRRHFRVQCMLPASLVLGEHEVEGLITDIGLGGARFVHRFKDEPPPEIRVEDLAVLRCLLLGLQGMQKIRCRVRNVSQDSAQLTLGVCYEGLEPQLLEQIRGYVNRVVKLMEEEA